MRIIDLVFKMEVRTYDLSRLNGDLRSHVDPLARKLF
jgi:hypothetical protein